LKNCEPLLFFAAFFATKFMSFFSVTLMFFRPNVAVSLTSFCSSFFLSRSFFPAFFFPYLFPLLETLFQPVFLIGQAV